MTPAEFVRKWSDSQLRERQGSQEHFIDLCRLLGEPTPAEDDPRGERYCFERGAEKTGGGDGWADVWRRGCFGWEYKGKHKDLNAALRQLQAYALNLENPPYLVVSDMERIIVHTNWTNTISRRLEFTFDDLLDPAKLNMLRAVFTGSEDLKPKVSPQELTAKVAERFGELSQRLQNRGNDPRAVAHFLNRLVFCMFAEDAGLLPESLFSRTVKATMGRPDAAQAQLTDLFGKMASPGETFFGADLIRWFNGGLFDDASTLRLEPVDLNLVASTAEEHDWSEIDPSVFGTLFEQALKATRERPALGAHYTDRQKILKIVDPVIVRPLTAEWQAVLAEIRDDVEAMRQADEDRKAVFEEAGEQMKLDPGAAKAGEAKRQKRLREIAKRRDAAYGKAHDRAEAWLTRLANYRVLDPACGSGNFLYVALHALLDIERRAIVDAERLGLTGFVPRVDLNAVKGIELDSYAAELARLTLWIGYLQWMRKNAARPVEDPVLSNLDQIENRDALLNPDGTEAEWPQVNAIIGNPPFLGAKSMKRKLGVKYTETLRARFSERLPGFSDFVCFWVEKARYSVDMDVCDFVGLVTTSSICGGTNQPVMKRIEDQATFFDAWSNIPWNQEGANVEASIFCFSKYVPNPIYLNGSVVKHINSDLSTGTNVARAMALKENSGFASLGIQKSGPLDIHGTIARQWIRSPSNPNGIPNSQVIRPYFNGDDVTGRTRDYWLIDLPIGCSETEVALFELPFEYLSNALYDPDKSKTETLKQARQKARDRHAADRWWEPYWPRPELRRNLKNLKYYLATPETSEHRFFVLLDSSILPDKNLIVFPKWNDTSFGILESKFHRTWALRIGTSLEDRPRYTSSTTVETFPFPEGLTPNIPAAEYAADPRAVAIADAARELNAKREAWLNPEDLVIREPEVVPGYPDRILPRNDEAAKVLKKRTLTELYNQRPAWLDLLHKRIDDAVAAAYGWPTTLTDDEILERLFALNQERAAAGR